LGLGVARQQVSYHVIDLTCLFSGRSVDKGVTGAWLRTPGLGTSGVWKGIWGTTEGSNCTVELGPEVLGIGGL
jgi:hypothetical protein